MWLCPCRAAAPPVCSVSEGLLLTSALFTCACRILSARGGSRFQPTSKLIGVRACPSFSCAMQGPSWPRSRSCEDSIDHHADIPDAHGAGAVGCRNRRTPVSQGSQLSSIEHHLGAISVIRPTNRWLCKTKNAQHESRHTGKFTHTPPHGRTPPAAYAVHARYSHRRVVMAGRMGNLNELFS